jgi:sugar/nucleoside kinase (ribokinase family)
MNESGGRVTVGIEASVHDAQAVFDVLVRGRPSVDLTFLGMPHLPRLGEEYDVTGFAMNPGASFTNATSMKRLGLRVGYATGLGSDFFSRFILERIRAEQIDETFLRFYDLDLTNVSVGISFPEDRTFITWNANPRFEGRVVTVDDLRHNRVRSLFTHAPYGPDMFDEARRQGIPIYVDAFWNPEYLRSDIVLRAIAQADAFMPNLAEALTITGAHDSRGALATLMELTPMVIIKLGAEGAIGGANGKLLHVPSLPVDVVDTTGAGDNFDAGMIYGLLHEFPFEKCLRCAVAAGSLSTRFAGGVDGSPSETEMLDAVARLEHIQASA